MKVQLFTISTDVERMIFDQNSLNDFLSTVCFKKSSAHFVESEIGYWSVLVHYDEEESEGNQKPKTSNAVRNTQTPAIDLNEKQQQIFETLKQWRNRKAVEQNLSAYVIAYNSELMNVALQNPETITELQKIKGFGEIKTAKHGLEIIKILKQF